MAKPETLFWTNKVKPMLEEIGLSEPIFFEKISQRSIVGIPDILIIFRGCVALWELKIPPNKVEHGSMQWLKLRSASTAGALSREVTPENLEESIKELLCLESLSENQRPKPYRHPKDRKK